MFQLENEKIGNHLSGLIDKKFKSKRQFCIACLKAGGMEASSEEIRKMANRISQIIKGKKTIQIYDLPIFTELLDVSCEEILSGGICFEPYMNRLTNYSVSFEKDENIWEQYINRDDKLILNTDEYGKTVIDYALEHKNFEFLKYLMEHKYIWFVDTEKANYYSDFGAGTNIESRPFYERNRILWYVSCPDDDRKFQHREELMTDDLRYRLAGNDNLRMQMISLAIEHNEIELLYQLHAREIPSLYRVSYITCMWSDCNSFYDKDMVIHVAQAGKQVLDYFSEEFEIKDSMGKINNFLFPYMSNLIDFMIKERNIFSEKLVERSIQHNKNTYEQLKELINKSIDCRVEYIKTKMYYNDREYMESLKENMIDITMRGFDYCDNGDMICFTDATGEDGIVTNIIHVNEKSDNNNINLLIQELNNLYDKIRNIKNEYCKS